MEDLEIAIKGEVTASNFTEWNAALIKRINETKTELVTDKDFADADVTIKSYKSIEKRLDEVKQTAMEQSRDIMVLFDSIDELRSHVRDKRLVLNRQLTNRKREIREELVNSSIERIKDALLKYEGVFPLLDHSDLLVKNDFADAIKRKSSLKSAQVALDRLVEAKIAEMGQRFHLVSLNERMLDEAAQEYEFLFNDRKSLLLKDSEHLEIIISNRVISYKQNTSKTKVVSQDSVKTPEEVEGYEEEEEYEEDDEVEATLLTGVDKKQFIDALKTIANGKNPFTGNPLANSLYLDPDSFAHDLSKLIEEIEQ